MVQWNATFKKKLMWQNFTYEHEKDVPNRLNEKAAYEKKKCSLTSFLKTQLPHEYAHAHVCVHTTRTRMRAYQPHIHSTAETIEKNQNIKRVLVDRWDYQS